MRFLAVLFALALLSALPTAASATTRTETFRVGPIGVDPYEVKQEEAKFGIPKPAQDAAITRMEVDVVDEDGTPVSIKRLMLHHIVFSNVGESFGAKKDATCDSITALDSKTKLPAIVERFYAAGEERAQLQLPQGYGYHSRAKDTWAMTWMVMNHRAKRDTAYIQYKVTYDDEPGAAQDVQPVWLDVRNCKADPVYDVAGGGKKGAVDEQETTWTVPANGRIVAGGGHLHGGGKTLELSQPACDDRILFRSKPKWGLASHPFYTVKPVLHEPGPVSMSGFNTAQGFKVSAGEEVKLTSVYDAVLPHSRVMGILVLFFARDDAAARDCATRPTDVTDYIAPGEGRFTPPEVTVPLTGLDAQGKAVVIDKPKGRLMTGRSTTVGDRFFSKPNLLVDRGSTVRWTFDSEELHDVTLASGPRAFSSPHLNGKRVFTKKLTAKGTYKLFCSLHPVAMQQRLVVR